MQMIKGKTETVQKELEEYYTSIKGIVLFRTGRSESITYPKYNMLHTAQSINICFTGESMHQMTLFHNKQTGEACAFILGGEIDIPRIMNAAGEAVLTIYGEYGFRACRAVLMSFGKHLEDALGEFAMKSEQQQSTDDLAVNIRIDELEALQNVDWIEDILLKGTDTEE
ncbi:hypothetical protein GCM10010916_38310 [Paenibacillus abyssi]|uniref:Uncharacterized protein n=1 Tax=Paenibacillus abyssi TaxID=1340531 RepID=A0A917G199_9BACL|nr:hypothetical protein GCM10010916_38310 [Paenibacillus abyssi]